MKFKNPIVVCSVVILAAGAVSQPKPAAVASSGTARAQVSQETRVGASSPEAAGRYIVRTSGCNDCHTPNFMVEGEKVPEAKWLVGNPIGFRGPWGTTYPQNLRRFVQPFTEEQFVEVVRKRHDRPPMPWSQLHAMSDADLKAVYRYAKLLGRTYGLDAPAPDYVAPDQEPKTPFIFMVPQNLPPMNAPQPASASTGASANAR